MRIAIDGYRALVGTGAAGGIRRRIEHDAQPAPLHSSSTAENLRSSAAERANFDNLTPAHKLSLRRHKRPRNDLPPHTVTSGMAIVARSKVTVPRSSLAPVQMICTPRQNKIKAVSRTRMSVPTAPSSRGTRSEYAKQM